MDGDDEVLLQPLPVDLAYIVGVAVKKVTHHQRDIVRHADHYHLHLRGGIAVTECVLKEAVVQRTFVLTNHILKQRHLTTGLTQVRCIMVVLMQDCVPHQALDAFVVEREKPLFVTMCANDLSRREDGSEDQILLLGIWVGMRTFKSRSPSIS